jgi:gluconolactonase
VGESEHVYFTDPAFGEQSDHRELDFYGVYHLPPRGPMKLVARPAGRPRGIALSPNGRRTDSWLRPVRDVQLVTAA